jgi:Cu(I)/Ag(I) efflux system membrane protein CusA/SilA
VQPEERSPINKVVLEAYRSIMRSVLNAKAKVILFAALVIALTLWPAFHLGAEFMPTLNEGTLFYMPTTLPGISINKASELLQMQNRIIKEFPEVESAFGKAGRATTATDPAPTEMFETVINLKPEHQWRPKMTIERLISEMDAALQFPGVSNAWTMPIKARTDMLTTGIKTTLGVKVIGQDLETIENIARQIEAAVKTVPGASGVYAERVMGGRYLDIEPSRHEIARLGLSVVDVQSVISSVIGAEIVTTTVEGRERYGVTLRYPWETRSNPYTIAREVFVPLPNGESTPLGQVADIKIVRGPAAIRTENAQLVGYVLVEARERDLASFVTDAKRVVADSVKFPSGYYAVWSGQFENYERAKQRVAFLIPLTLVLIFTLLYMNFRSLAEVLIVMLSLPFALVGGIWLMWWMDFRLSVASAVGFIALAGVAAETGVIMLIFLENAWSERREAAAAQGISPTQRDLYCAIMDGAVGRVRPKIMTVCAVMAALLPIMWGREPGSEIMQRIAAPMIGGMASSTVLTLIVIPAIYSVVKGASLASRERTGPLGRLFEKIVSRT